MATPAAILFTYAPTKEQHIENVRKLILECSGLKQEWIDFIKNDTVLYSYLLEAVSGLVTDYTNQSRAKMIPDEPTKILAALKYCRPADVKVIILGYDPVKESDLATGLAMSLPDGVTKGNRREKYRGKGKSVEYVHDALEAAGIEPGDSLNHEHWAERGVLLLNACLTLDPGNNGLIFNESRGPGKLEKPHFQYWENFTTQLVIKLLREKILQTPKTPIFVLCWGTHAEYVGEALLPDTAQTGGITLPQSPIHTPLSHAQTGGITLPQSPIHTPLLHAQTGGITQPQPPIRPPLRHAQTDAVLTHSAFRNDTDHMTDPQSLEDVDYVVYIGNHPRYHAQGSHFSFKEQAPNQFRTIEHFHPGLFGPRADVIDELAERVDQL